MNAVAPDAMAHGLGVGQEYHDSITDCAHHLSRICIILSNWYLLMSFIVDAADSNTTIIVTTDHGHVDRYDQKSFNEYFSYYIYYIDFIAFMI